MLSRVVVVIAVIGALTFSAWAAFAASPATHIEPSGIYGGGGDTYGGGSTTTTTSICVPVHGRHGGCVAVAGWGVRPTK